MYFCIQDHILLLLLNVNLRPCYFLSCNFVTGLATLQISFHHTSPEAALKCKGNEYSLWLRPMGEEFGSVRLHEVSVMGSHLNSPEKGLVCPPIEEAAFYHLGSLENSEDLRWSVRGAGSPTHGSKERVKRSDFVQSLPSAFNACSGSVMNGKEDFRNEWQERLQG